jgi:PIN domain nuclease of toxin-antitoxin system
MKLLFDTHALIWFAEDSPQFTAAALKAIREEGAEVFCSAANIWEIAIKAAIGKLQLVADLQTEFRSKLAQNNIVFLPIQYEHAARVAVLPFHHRDPFDRLLVAQTLIEDMSLISHDKVLDAYGIRRIW